MSCNSCKSDNSHNFGGEVAVHFLGLKGLDMPVVWVFPNLKVCFACGLTEFEIPKNELRVLEQNDFEAAA
jgi:hypothetical protein